MAAAFGATMIAAGEKGKVTELDENLATDAVSQSCFKVGLFNTDEFMHDARNFGASLCTSFSKNRLVVWRPG